MMARQSLLNILLTFLLIPHAFAQSGTGGNYKDVSRMLGSDESLSFFLEDCTFSADVPFSHAEFFYIAQLTPGKFVSKLDIERAKRNLMQKHRFSTIDIDIKESPKGKIVHFTLQAAWLLKNLNITGFWFGKYEYLGLYSQQPGDVFDQHIHEDSLLAMEKHLHEQGYFNATLTDELVYEAEYKTIVCNINIDRGLRYSIKKIAAIVQPDDSKKITPAQLSRLTRDLIKVTTKHQRNRRYSKQFAERIGNNLKSVLYKHGFFHPRIKLQKKMYTRDNDARIGLTFVIEPGKQKVILFRGNSLFSDEEIRNLILDPEQPDWLFTPDILTEQLTHDYMRKGYWQAQVTCNKADNTYTFTIDEGQPTIVEKIEVKDADSLTSEMTDHFWQSLLQGQPLDQDELDKKLAQLKKMYQKNGYWDFAIIDQQLIKSDLTSQHTVIIFIAKGEQRLWGGMHIESFEHLTSLDGLKKFQLRSQTQKIPFDLGWLQEQKTCITQYFQQEGYWYADITAQIKEDVIGEAPDGEPKLKKVAVTWQINPGPQVTFGKVIVRGNTTLPFTRILNEIKFKEGEVWSKEKLDLTRKKLKRLDIFKRIQVQAQQSNKKTDKPIVITLTDDAPVELRLRAGIFWTDKNFLYKWLTTYKLGASVAVKNPTNHADKLTLDTDITRFERKLNLEYQQPSLFNLPMMGKVKAYTNKYIHPVSIGRSRSAYVAHQTGALIGLGDEYKENYYWGINTGSEFIRTSRVKGQLKLDPSMINKTAAYFFVEPTLAIDKLDDKLNTTTGTFTFAGLKLMLPTNIGTFTARASLEESFFYPIYTDVVLATRLRLGHIFRRSFEFIMPIDRFYLGGPSSVRGYEKDSLPPLGSEVDEYGDTQYTIQGGSSMVNANVEIRFPLYHKLAGVVFQDIGALSQSGMFGFNKTWYPTTGFGIRYKTPIGPLRFDIGWKWKKFIKEDSSFAWYLTLGEAF